MSDQTHHNPTQRPPRTGGVRAVLFWESLWPTLIKPLGLVAVFVLFSLFGLWRFMSWPVHYAVLGLLAFGIIYHLWRDVRHIDWPSKRTAQRRLEQDGKVPLGSVRGLEDVPFTSADAENPLDNPLENPLENPLWRLHQQRLAQAAKQARLKGVRATADLVDPWQIRYGAALLILLALVINHRDLGPRMAAGFSPQLASGVPVTVDLWVDPPAYTGRPPVIITQSSLLPEGRQAQLEIPAGSVINIRLHGAKGKAIGQLETVDGHNKIDFKKQAATLLAEVTIGENAALSIGKGATRSIWPIAIIPDRAPTIEFTDEPEATTSGTIRLPLAVGDDYGVADAVAIFTLDPEQDRPLDAPLLEDSQLAKIEQVPLASLRGNPGPRVVELNLEEHPWAGLEIRLRIKITDGAGQSAETFSEPITLPERQFYNPVARAIIDERRNLAVAPKSWPRTSRALFALSDRSIAPEQYYDSAADYLLVRTAFYKVANGRGENIDRTIKEFWPLALQLEDQALELARRALAAAQNALREALERGAPEQEILALIEELRAAMQNYIAALAESGQAELADGQQSEELETTDLDDLLNDIAKLSEAGANNAARQLLAELEQMLNNLKISQGGSGQSSGQGMGQSSGKGQGSGQGDQSQGRKALDAAGQLIGRQRDLADETFSATKGEGKDGGNPRGSGALKSDQDGIGGDVKKLSDALKGIKLEDEDTKDAIDRAGSAYDEALERMNEASRAIGANRLGAATRAQDEAIAALRDGAGAIAEARQAASKARGKNGQGGKDGQAGLTGGQSGIRNGAANNLDPLGRPFGGAPVPGQEVGIPDYSDPDKARELIEELRRRIAEPGRSKEEIEYLERLLERF